MKIYRYSLVGTLFRYSGYFAAIIVSFIILLASRIENESIEYHKFGLILFIAFAYLSAFFHHYLHPIIAIDEHSTHIKFIFKFITLKYDDIKIHNKKRTISRLFFPYVDPRYSLLTIKNRGFLTRLAILTPFIKDYDSLIDLLEKKTS